MGLFKHFVRALSSIPSSSDLVNSPVSERALNLSSDGVRIYKYANYSSSASYNGKTSAITCSYPKLEKQGWKMCNTNETRDCWLVNPLNAQSASTQYDIQTNTEDEALFLTGVTREYWITIDRNNSFTPYGEGGTLKTEGKLINNTFPGPLIEACWGDEIVIHVTNKHPLNGTTIHWHGIRQFMTNDMDGANGVTQCPIAPNQTFTYRFNATQYGHTWYHSHYSLQYADGVAGPLIIHGPTSKDWDEDLGPFHVTDWVDDTAFRAYEQEAFQGFPPQADSILVNGIGQASNTTSGPWWETTVTKGKSYLLRLINGSAGLSYLFSIDNHNFTVVAVDLVPVLPYTTNSIVVGNGQRYTIVIEANQDVGDYWIRTAYIPGCSAFNINPVNTTAILHYEGGNNTVPDTNDFIRDIDSVVCRDEPSENLVPVVPWTINRISANNFTDTFELGFEKNVDPSKFSGHPYAHWVLNKSPLWVNFSDPTLLQLDQSSWSPDLVLSQENFKQGYLYLIIDAGNSNTDFRNIAVAHPIHLHGSDFVILRQADRTEKWDPKESPKKFNYDNPTRRDTAFVEGGGYLAIAFKPDNPGAWLVHCHIAWHASSGLALQLLIRQDEIEDMIGSQRMDDLRQTCDQWKASDLAEHHAGADQLDSGI